VHHDDEQAFPSVTGSTVASGKYAIVAIAVLAAGLVAFGLWFHYQQQRAALEFWGTDTAERIVQAPQVEAWLLESGDGEVQADGRTWRVLETRDVSRAPGFSHVRLSLIKDGSFRWTAAPPTAPVEWRYALVFRDSPSAPSGDFDARDAALVLFSRDCEWLLLATSGRTAAVPALSVGMRQFFSEQISPASDEPSE